MIYEVERDGEITYSVSSHSCWLPGVYKTRRAAKYAPQFADMVLQAMQDALNSWYGSESDKNVITFEMLQFVRKNFPYKEGTDENYGVIYWGVTRHLSQLLTQSK